MVRVGVHAAKVDAGEACVEVGGETMADMADTRLCLLEGGVQSSSYLMGNQGHA